MATHSSVLAWRIPGTGEPSGLLSMGLHRVRHDWSNLAAAAAYSYWQKALKTFLLLLLLLLLSCFVTSRFFNCFHMKLSLRLVRIHRTGQGILPQWMTQKREQRGSYNSFLRHSLKCHIVCLPYSDSYEWVNKYNPHARKENYFHFLKEKVP